MSKLAPLLASALLILTTACSVSNRQLNDLSTNRNPARTNQTFASTQPNLVDSDGYFVGVSISGGGSRSAIFGAAALFELQRVGLLQKVDYLSSVSGGSLTAAYYCLNDEKWAPATVQSALSHSFASDMLVDALLPWNMLALLFTEYNKSDLLVKTLRSNLFTANGKSQTFADLRPDRPRLIINGTNLQSGKRFTFTNSTFDKINSDLASFEIARAVAASAAVPVLIDDISLRDYSTAFKQYLHIVDGGIHDNLGVSALIDTYQSAVKHAADEKRPSPYPKGIVLIVIDAATDYDSRLGDSNSIGLFDAIAAGVGLTSTTLINRASDATMADLIVRGARDSTTAGELRAAMQSLKETGRVKIVDRSSNTVEVFHFSLNRISTLRDLPFTSFRERVNNVATYFNIRNDEAHDLTKAAEMLFHEQFEQSLQNLSAEMDKGTPTTRTAQ